MKNIENDLNKLKVHWMMDYSKLWYALVALLSLVTANDVRAADGQLVHSTVQNQDNLAQEPEEPKEPLIYQAACPFVLQGIARGKILPPISDGACGENAAYEISHVSGLELSSAAVLNCNMIAAFSAWAVQIGESSMRNLNTKIKQINVSTSYQCRRRNNAPTGKISEHGFANALDVVGFLLENGEEISIENDWPVGSGIGTDGENTEPSIPAAGTARFLQEIHQAACIQFTTVLGPESNEAHRDHFHFDLGCHGRDCTYRICE